jgi:hypothetical protein
VTDDWKWLESTRQLQIEAYGKDPGELVGDERGNYWTTMMFAASDEISEFGNEIHWKPWGKNRGEIINKSAALGELVDVQHFVANLLLSIGVTEDEFWAAYREKQERNKARQQTGGGYDSKKTKCPNCKRELDKPGSYRSLRVRVGTGAGTQEDVESGILTHSLQCVSCFHQFDYELKTGEKLP